MKKLDITDLDICEVLAALCNNTKPLGLGKMNSKANEVITTDTCAQAFLEHTVPAGEPVRFDYFCGRPIKVAFHIEGDKTLMDYWWLYDRDSPTTVAAILEGLRKETNGKTKT